MVTPPASQDMDLMSHSDYDIPSSPPPSPPSSPAPQTAALMDHTLYAAPNTFLPSTPTPNPVRSLTSLSEAISTQTGDRPKKRKKYVENEDGDGFGEVHYYCDHPNLIPTSEDDWSFFWCAWCSVTFINFNKHA